MATLKEVAERAGVAPSIASRILNGKPIPVTPATRARVLAAAEELRYRPNAQARGLRQRRSSTLGVLLPDLGNPFFLELLTGIRRRAGARGYYLLLGDVVADRRAEESYIAVLRERRVDGLIVASAFLDDAAVEAVAREGFPFAVVTRRVSGVEHAFVGTDDREGMRLAVAHLATLGHRRIAHLAGPVLVESALFRLQGYRLGLHEAGIPFRPEYVRETDFREETGRAAMKALLELPEPPTAVVAASDMAAVGALAALQEAGLRVPEDVSVVGYNDIALARLTTPPLTTVHMPIEAMGEAAVDVVLAALEGMGRRGPVVFPPHLVVRGSSGPAPPG